MKYSDCIAKETAAMLALTVFVFVALYLSSDGAQARPIANSPCLPDDSLARGWVDRALTMSSYQKQRQKTGLTGISPEDVQLLDDGPVCETLKNKYMNPENRLRFTVIYTAGDRILVARPIQYDPDKNGGWVVAGKAFLVIHDMSLNELGTFIE